MSVCYNQSMLKNIFLELEYDGTDYFGWQIQDKKLQVTGHRLQAEKTVQGELEKALKKLFKQGIRVIYAGRTDRGVHARQQCVNFKIETDIPLKNVKTALNAFLPPDIFIKKIKQVPLDFHARFKVRSKIYRYLIFNKARPSVFTRNYAQYMPESVDLDKIRKIIPFLLGKKDVSCFAKEANKYKTCVREIKGISVKRKGACIYFDIEADGFLRNMARNIVAFLVKVGRDKFSLIEAKDIISGKKSYINKPAPPQGLYLHKVKY